MNHPVDGQEIHTSVAESGLARLWQFGVSLSGGSRPGSDHPAKEKIRTMPIFQGSGFSVELPEETIDASSYCFSFPESGEFSPNLMIKCERQQDEIDLSAYVNEQRAAICAGVENFKVISDTSKNRGSWNYLISVVEWGPDEKRTRQKQLIVYVPGEIPRLYTLTATDFAANFKRSEPLFDQVIRTFNPNDIQAF